MNTVGKVFPFLLLCLILACTGPAKPTKVENGSRPSQAIWQWHLQEEWRAASDPDELVVGSIVDACLDEAGKTYLLDIQQQKISVFAPGGKILRVLDYQGESPAARDLVRRLVPGKDQIGLLNTFPVKIAWLDAKGSPAGSVSPVHQDDYEAVFSCCEARVRADRIIWALTRSSTGQDGLTSTHQVVSSDRDGHILSQYLNLDGIPTTGGQMNQDFDEGKLFNPFEGRWDVDPLGRVWIAPEKDRYHLQVFQTDGRLVLETGREYRSPAETPEPKMRVRNTPKVDDHFPCIAKLWIMENRWGTNVWVESGASHHELPPGVMVRYDLFDLEGHFTHQVDIVGDGDPLFDQWFLVGQDRLILVRNAPAGGFQRDGSPHPHGKDHAREVISYRFFYGE